MIIARKGDSVVCSAGHVNGHVGKDISDTDVIRPKDFGLDNAATTITPTDDGHVCFVCGERITKLYSGTYAIQTSRGWIGKA
jgi:hypothetical protein